VSAPPTTTVARGRCSSAPVPREKRSGATPSMVVRLRGDIRQGVNGQILVSADAPSIVERVRGRGGIGGGWMALQSYKSSAQDITFAAEGGSELVPNPEGGSPVGGKGFKVGGTGEVKVEF